VLGEGLPILPVGDIKIHPIENFLAAGTYGRSMYKIDLNLLTNINDEQILVIKEFSLLQNYPNPFNPTTTISWQSSIGSLQTLKIYDVLGNLITTLVDEYMPAGKHEINFDASSLSSGVYLYKLSSGKYSETKKMLVLK
jgi:hypothetical protein